MSGVDPVCPDRRRCRAVRHLPVCPGGGVGCLPCVSRLEEVSGVDPVCSDSKRCRVLTLCVPTGGGEGC